MFIVPIFIYLNTHFILNIMQQTTLDFNATTVTLEGKNLIEASAGTGKTYSIALLSLRLILEQKIPITELLLVTFTNAAVAELERRIKDFVHDAKLYIVANTPCDPSIMEIADKAIAMHDLATCQQLINDAQILLDELPVKTIHSFCQMILQEFAMETKQGFGLTLKTDNNDTIERCYNLFWRKHITNLPLAVIEQLDINNFREQTLHILMNHMHGKTYAQQMSDEDLAIYLPMLHQKDGITAYVNDKIATLHQTLTNYIQDHKDVLIAKLGSKRIFKKELKDDDAPFTVFWDTVEERMLKDKKDTIAILALFFDDDMAAEKEEYIYLKYNKSLIKNILIALAIKEVTAAVNTMQQKANYLTYDDIVVRLHQAITRPNSERLTMAIRQKFKAVFVDEFQDTDKEQFEIFSTAFAEDTIVFFIGDPKQSIYAFRKADIATYFKARHFVDRCFTMNTNYRSATDFIASMNEFFQPDEAFDTFHFNNQEDEINYITVKAPEPNAKGRFLFPYENDAQLQVHIVDKKDTAFTNASHEIANMLHGEQYLIEKNGRKRRILPQDIGVLIRNGSDGLDMQQRLVALGIPAVMKNDSKVFDHAVCAWIATILNAIITKNTNDIKTAMSNPLMELSLAQLQQLDELALLVAFEQMQETWLQKGISACLIQFQNLFGLTTNWLVNQNSRANLAVFNQIIEILHNTAYYKKLNAKDILIWLQKGIDDLIPSEDSYVQNMESDEAAVQIITIHASKGLEYNIVVCPNLSLNDGISGNRTMQSYRGSDGVYYFNATKNLTNEELDLVNEQNKQENRRLLYVAVTRAVYHCKMYNISSMKGNMLKPFIEALTAAQHPSIAIIKAEETTSLANDDTAIVSAPIAMQTNRYFDKNLIPTSNWNLLSYSKIAPHLPSIRYKRSDHYQDEYDKFIFYKLKSGADIGNFLHGLIEKIDFNNALKWDKTIEKAVGKFYHKTPDGMVENLKKFIEHITEAQIIFGDKALNLKNISKAQRLTELEFHFPLSKINLTAIDTLLHEQYNMSLSSFHAGQLEGMMHGFIDLVFEDQGKFYILDWKSNYLGHTIEDYQTEQLELAMQSNGYHLQYLLYTLALHLYLESRMPNYDYEVHFGGVIYLFLRGVRKEGTTGIFTHRPNYAAIKSMMQ